MEVQIRNRVWLEMDGAKYMGKGHVQLLRAIQETGSLNGASKKTGISYRKTWRLINKINELSPREVVQLQKGGAGGGGARVTPYGLELLKFFERLLAQSEKELKALLALNQELWS
ncbi:winged helix-turn-helix domain-containing protein [Croceiramulus getboli]|nr:LysR family transcriptional regulator [Flavobacteriaceae bacterium YJPT1-3]